MAVQVQGQTGGPSYIANVDSNGNLYVTLANSDIGGLAFVGTLTHNAAAPAASTQIGVLPAVASSAAPTYNAGDQVLLSTDLSGNLRVTQAANSSVSVNQWDGTALGAPSAQGTLQTSGNLISTNSQIFVGTNAVRTNQTTTAAGVVDTNIVGVLGVTHSKTNSVFTAIADQTNVITAAISAMGSAPTGTEVMMVNNVNFAYNGSTYNALTCNSTTITSKFAQDQNLTAVLGATHAKTNGVFSAICDQTNVITAAISAIGVAPTGTEVMMVNSTNFVYNGSAYVKQTANSATQTASADINLVSVLGATHSATNPVFTQSVPATAGGTSTAVSQALTTTINVKGTAGQLYGYTLSNPNSTVAYVMYYNTATTPGTIGSSTNLLLEILIPAGATANMEWSNGIAFSSGIAVAVATTATGNTAPGIGLVITSLYK